METLMHIGLDDTDSIKTGCTTYIASILVEKLSRLGVNFFDYPNLVRLNPNIPWKTRGNGALCLRIKIDDCLINDAMEEITDIVEKESDLKSPRTDPGIVFFLGKIPPELNEFSSKVVQDIVEKKEAISLIKKYRAEALYFKNGRGVIGALAAIGEELTRDYTYELICYRIPKNRGKNRKVNSESVFKMDKISQSLVFNNVDREKKRVLITPRGPDPVLLGIRGENPHVIKKAYNMIEINEEVERWVIFRTNQGTDAHLIFLDEIRKVKPHRSFKLVGKVSGKPRVIRGGHVIFTLKDETGQIDCAAYEPTGEFRQVVKKLLYDDVVEVYGGVRPASKTRPTTINLEKIRLCIFSPIFSFENPFCEKCGKRMESMGKGKGLRCKKCGFRDRGREKTKIEIERGISLGIYTPPPRANRHLTKPIIRYGLEKKKFSDEPKDFWGLGEVIH